MEKQPPALFFPASPQNATSGTVARGKTDAFILVLFLAQALAVMYWIHGARLPGMKSGL